MEAPHGNPLSQERLDPYLNPFQALGDETRLRILVLLANQPDGVTFSEIQTKIGGLPYKTFNELAALANVGLIHIKMHEQHDCVCIIQQDKTTHLLREFSHFLATAMRGHS